MSIYGINGDGSGGNRIESGTVSQVCRCGRMETVTWINEVKIYGYGGMRVVILLSLKIFCRSGWWYRDGFNSGFICQWRNLCGSVKTIETW